MLNKIFYLAFLVLLCLVFRSSSTTNTSNSRAGCSVGSYSDGNSCLECGFSKFYPDVKIVGGVNAVKGSWPAQVFLTQTYYVTAAQRFTTSFCGGTLIKPNLVLTAAHCIRKSFSIDNIEYPYRQNGYYPTFESTFTMYLGAHDISFIQTGVKPPSDVLVARAVRVVTHERYNPYNLLNDIALIKMDTSVKLNDYINTACLPRSDIGFPSTSQAVYVSGWGTTYEGGSISTILRNVKMTVYDSSKCSSVSPFTTKNWFSQICAGEYVGGKDSCQGDSGGGLMVQDTILGKTKYFVAGIVSYGDGCGRAGYPGIYTRTSYYIDWIEANGQNQLTSSLHATSIILSILALLSTIFI